MSKITSEIMHIVPPNIVGMMCGVLRATYSGGKITLLYSDGSEETANLEMTAGRTTSVEGFPMKRNPDITSERVMAIWSIADSPLSRDDASAQRGAIGSVVDYDSCAELYFVDFGRGAIACEADELRSV